MGTTLVAAHRRVGRDVCAPNQLATSRLRAFRRAISLMVLAATPGISVASQGSSACEAPHCGLLKDGAYDHYVIGTVDSVGDDDDLRTVFGWAKHHGWWKKIPDDVSPYIKNVKMVRIRLPDADSTTPVTVFIQIEEFSAAAFPKGALVRYAPHDNEHTVPPEQHDRYALFYGLTGCVAVLCGTDNAECQGRYRPGVFQVDTGEQVDIKTDNTKPSGIRISPGSLLPILKTAQ